MNSDAVKLFESLQKLKVTEENKEEVEKIKQDIRNKDFKKALERIEKIQNNTSKVEKNNNATNKETNKRGRKKKKTEIVDEKQEKDSATDIKNDASKDIP